MNFFEEFVQMFKAVIQSCQVNSKDHYTGNVLTNSLQLAHTETEKYVIRKMNFKRKDFSNNNNPTYSLIYQDNY